MINKWLCCTLAGLSIAFASPAQTLFTYGTHPVSQAEFIRAFEKNPTPGDRKKAMQEYLPLYVNYKLKVQDALDKKMDTLPGQQAELQNYTSQLVEAYINGKSDLKSLTKEAFDYSQKDILLGHFFISFNPVDSNDIRTAFAQAQKAKAALEAQQPLAEVANQYSNDESIKASGGKAGWITVFSIPSSYEKAVYALPVGGYSAIFRGTTGFHIFQKIAERPAVGKVQVAQILLVNIDEGEAGNPSKRLADSLYQVLQSGAPFDSVAFQFSNDRTSYDNGGVLPEFGVGTYDEIFEREAFQLKQIGSISKPFKTDYGWHILKLISKTPLPTTLEEADVNNQLTEKVLNSGRAEAARNNYLASELPKLGYKAGTFTSTDLWRFTDSATTGGNIQGQKITDKTVLFYFGKTMVTASDWLQYVRTSRFSSGGVLKPYPEMLKDFIAQKEIEYLHKNLQNIDADFAVQYNEFKDANLLFEAMDKNVWTKSSLDTTGLRKYYNDHHSKYKWAASANAILVTTEQGLNTTGVRSEIVKDPSSWHDLRERFGETILPDSGRYELAQLPFNVAGIQPGSFTEFITNDLDKTQTFAYILSLLPVNEQRSFEDAKGFVINDYQQILEAAWIDQLRKKYPVVINQANWNKLLATSK